MGYYKRVNFKITGSVDADRTNIYEVLEAELKLICAKYELELEVE